MTKKVAVVMFNLGGPDKLSSVQPFLFNLFYDRAIIDVVNPLRWVIAQIISLRRTKIAKEIYKQINGKSPILELTKEQGKELEKKLKLAYESQIFIGMRYWHPLISESVKKVKIYNPDEIILLPLYPQFSKTTSGSSLNEWNKESEINGLNAPTKVICCYPEDPGWIGAQVDLIKKKISSLNGLQKYRMLFSAHGLPKNIIMGGDPYQNQIERTVGAIIKKLDIKDLDWNICYQSKVGPLEWIGPSTESELQRAANDNQNIIIVPIAFVSDHSETLVEIDLEYKELSEKLGIEEFHRIPVVGTHPEFIEGLYQIVINAIESNKSLISDPRNKNAVCCGRFSECQRFKKGR